MDLAFYPDELARLDIGIAPLASTRFNRAKSWLKPLELAACGVPVVMSDFAEYHRLHQTYGLGLVANTAADWHEAIVHLAQDRGLRLWMSVRSRQIVRDELTIERHCFDWIEAWDHATWHRRVGWKSQGSMSGAARTRTLAG